MGQSRIVNLKAQSLWVPCWKRIRLLFQITWYRGTHTFRGLRTTMSYMVHQIINSSQIMYMQLLLKLKFSSLWHSQVTVVDFAILFRPFRFLDPKTVTLQIVSEIYSSQIMLLLLKLSFYCLRHSQVTVVDFSILFQTLSFT